MGSAKEFVEKVESYMEELYESLGHGPHLTPREKPFGYAPDMIPVETENANYGQFMSFRIFEEEVPEDVLEETDAIVLESRTTPYEEYDLADKIHDNHYLSTNQLRGAITQPRELPAYAGNVIDELQDREHRGIIRQNLDGDQVPMYLVDLPSEAHLLERVTSSRVPKWMRKGGMRALIPRKTTMRHLFRVHPTYLAVHLLFGASGYLPKMLGVGKTPMSYLQVVKAPTSSGLQSAVAAEKLESHIAPQLEEELGRKPNILLMYDVKDMDIAAYLKRPRLRDFVIDKQAHLDYCLADTDYLNQVYEFRFDEDGEELLEHDGDTFHYSTATYDVDGLEARDCWSIPWPSTIYEYLRETTSDYKEKGQNYREYREVRNELDSQFDSGARLRQLQRKHQLTPAEEQERERLLQESIEHARALRELKESYFGDEPDTAYAPEEDYVPASANEAVVPMEDGRVSQPVED